MSRTGRITMRGVFVAVAVVVLLVSGTVVCARKLDRYITMHALLDAERVYWPHERILRPTLQMYAERHGGRFPNDLADILKDDQIVETFKLNRCRVFFDGSDAAAVGGAAGRRFKIVPNMHLRSGGEPAKLLVYPLAPKGGEPDRRVTKVLFDDLLIRYLTFEELLSLRPELTDFDVPSHEKPPSPS